MISLCLENVEAGEETSSLEGMLANDSIREPTKAIATKGKRPRSMERPVVDQRIMNLVRAP
jgi:hypothetical protein